jgi:hypothetical protein
MSSSNGRFPLDLVLEGREPEMVVSLVWLYVNRYLNYLCIESLPGYPEPQSVFLLLVHKEKGVEDVLCRGGVVFESQFTSDDHLINNVLHRLILNLVDVDSFVLSS